MPLAKRCSPGGSQVRGWAQSRLLRTEGIKEAGESNWSMAWKARDSLISSSAAGWFVFFFLIDCFLHPLAFFCSESAVKRSCDGGGNEVTDQKRL